MIDQRYPTVLNRAAGERSSSSSINRRLDTAETKPPILIINIAKGKSAVINSGSYDRERKERTEGEQAGESVAW